MLRSVMIPVDFSAESDLVMQFAQGLGTLGVRRVVLGHVVEASGMEGPVIAAKVDKVRDKIRGVAQRLSEAGLECEVRVATGDDIARELLAIATESHVDGVVAGTHGKGALSMLLERSVSEAVVWHAEVPVLLVRYDLLRNSEDPAALAVDFARQILVSTDFSSSSTRAFMSVLDLPASAIGTVYLLNAVDPALRGTKLSAQEGGAQFQLNNMAKMAEEQGIVARGVVRVGDAKQVILQEVNERRASGVVAGTRGTSPLQEAMLGSVSMTLIRQASCPVMIMP